MICMSPLIRIEPQLRMPNCQEQALPDRRTSDLGDGSEY